MFEFRNGMLGVTIIALALAGAIVGGYLAGIDSVEHEVTRFNELADVSGLYEYDTNPQYIDYDPSSNYTGYYSETSGKYFAVDEVGYTPNVDSSGKTQQNNYKIDLPPTYENTETKDLSNLPQTDVPNTEDGLNLMTFYTGPYDPNGNGRYSAACKGTTLTELLTYLDYTGEQYVRLASPNDLSVDISGATSENPVETGWVFFFPDSYVSHSGGNLLRNTVNLMSKETYDTFEFPSYVSPDVIKAIACQSCTIDVRAQQVTLYSDNQFQNRIGIYELSKMYMIYSETTLSFLTPSLILSDTATVTVQTFPDASYLNPNYGVQLKG